MNRPLVVSYQTKITNCTSFSRGPPHPGATGARNNSDQSLLTAVLYVRQQCKVSLVESKVYSKQGKVDPIGSIADKPNSEQHATVGILNPTKVNWICLKVKHILQKKRGSPESLINPHRSQRILKARDVYPNIK